MCERKQCVPTALPDDRGAADRLLRPPHGRGILRESHRLHHGPRGQARHQHVLLDTLDVHYTGLLFKVSPNDAPPF